jgi:hypothetical protein
MTERFHPWLKCLAGGVVTALLVTAPVAPAEEDASFLDPVSRMELAMARGATAAFHDLESAVAAGWWLRASPCEESALGGMGHHYVNLETWGAGLDVTRPQALLFEPQRNGRMRLVGVEYIVPRSVLGPEGPAPELFGQRFHWNEFAVGGIWALHVWLWRHNPAGLFADWNPNVTCEFAD